MPQNRYNKSGNTSHVLQKKATGSTKPPQQFDISKYKNTHVFDIALRPANHYLYNLLCFFFESLLVSTLVSSTFDEEQPILCEKSRFYKHKFKQCAALLNVCSNWYRFASNVSIFVDTESRVKV